MKIEHDLVKQPRSLSLYNGELILRGGIPFDVKHEHYGLQKKQASTLVVPDDNPEVLADRIRVALKNIVEVESEYAA